MEEEELSDDQVDASVRIDEDEPELGIPIATPKHRGLSETEKEDMNCNNCKYLIENAEQAWAMMTSYVQKLSHLQILKNENQQLSRINAEQQTYLASQRQKFCDMENELNQSKLKIADLEDRLQSTNSQYKQIFTKVNEAQEAANTWREKYDMSQQLLIDLEKKSKENYKLHISSMAVAATFSKNQELAEAKSVKLEAKLAELQKQNEELLLKVANLETRFQSLERQDPAWTRQTSKPFQQLSPPKATTVHPSLSEQLSLSNASLFLKVFSPPTSSCSFQSLERPEPLAPKMLQTQDQSAIEIPEEKSLKSSSLSERPEPLALLLSQIQDQSAIKFPEEKSLESSSLLKRSESSAFKSPEKQDLLLNKESLGSSQHLHFRKASAFDSEQFPSTIVSTLPVKPSPQKRLHSPPSEFFLPIATSSPSKTLTPPVPTYGVQLEEQGGPVVTESLKSFKQLSPPKERKLLSPLLSEKLPSADISSPSSVSINRFESGEKEDKLAVKLLERQSSTKEFEKDISVKEFLEQFNQLSPLKTSHRSHSKPSEPAQSSSSKISSPPIAATLHSPPSKTLSSSADSSPSLKISSPPISTLQNLPPASPQPSSLPPPSVQKMPSSLPSTFLDSMASTSKKASTEKSKYTITTCEIFASRFLSELRLLPMLEPYDHIDFEASGVAFNTGTTQNTSSNTEISRESRQSSNIPETSGSNSVASTSKTGKPTVSKRATITPKISKNAKIPPIISKNVKAISTVTETTNTIASNSAETASIGLDMPEITLIVPKQTRSRIASNNVKNVKASPNVAESTEAVPVASNSAETALVAFNTPEIAPIVPKPKRSRITPNSLKNLKANTNFTESTEAVPVASNSAETASIGLDMPEITPIVSKPKRSRITPNLPKNVKENPNVSESTEAVPVASNSVEIFPVTSNAFNATRNIPKRRSAPTIPKNAKVTSNISNSVKESPNVVEAGDSTPIASISTETATTAADLPELTPIIPKRARITSNLSKNVKSSPLVAESVDSSPATSSSAKITPAVSKRAKLNPTISKNAKITPIMPTKKGNAMSQIEIKAIKSNESETKPLGRKAGTRVRAKASLKGSTEDALISLLTSHFQLSISKNCRLNAEGIRASLLKDHADMSKQIDVDKVAEIMCRIATEANVGDLWMTLKTQTSTRTRLKRSPNQEMVLSSIEKNFFQFANQLLAEAGWENLFDLFSKKFAFEVAKSVNQPELSVQHVYRNFRLLAVADVFSVNAKQNDSAAKNDDENEETLEDKAKTDTLLNLVRLLLNNHLPKVFVPVFCYLLTINGQLLFDKFLELDDFDFELTLRQKLLRLHFTDSNEYVDVLKGLLNNRFASHLNARFVNTLLVVPSSKEIFEWIMEKVEETKALLDGFCIQGNNQFTLANTLIEKIRDCTALFAPKFKIEVDRFAVVDFCLAQLILVFNKLIDQNQSDMTDDIAEESKKSLPIPSLFADSLSGKNRNSTQTNVKNTSTNNANNAANVLAKLSREEAMPAANVAVLASRLITPFLMNVRLVERNGFVQQISLQIDKITNRVETIKSIVDNNLLPNSMPANLICFGVEQLLKSFNIFRKA